MSVHLLFKGIAIAGIILPIQALFAVVCRFWINSWPMDANAGCWVSFDEFCVVG
jgi:hypothetical protein